MLLNLKKLTNWGRVSASRRNILITYRRKGDDENVRDV